ncbi:6841_t:CDS:2, partial [Scutellospora calospora]
LVYQIEKDVILGPASQLSDVEAVEESPLLDLKTRANAIFIPTLDKELNKIITFYLSKENELFKEVTELFQDYAVFQNLEDSVSVRSSSAILSRSYQSSEGANRHSRRGSRSHRKSTSESVVSSYVSSDDDDGYNTPTTPTNRTAFFSSSPMDRRHFTWGPSSIDEQRIHLKRRAIDLFVWLSELKSFVFLNKTGFSKILKKYDKITGSNLKSSYLNNVNDAYPFKDSTLKSLDDQILKIQEIYSNICTNGDMDIAMRELKTHLREFIG